MRRQLLPILFLLPALGLLGFLPRYPLGRLFATSFQNLGPSSSSNHKVVWNGLANYRTLFASGGPRHLRSADGRLRPRMRGPDYG